MGRNSNYRRIIVVGGGAAGFFAAIACAEADPQAQVTLLEASRHLLAKVKISGGGRCNVTHACFEPALLVQHYPRGGKALRGAFTRFQPRDTINWFAAHHVKLKQEADGRMFPITDDSETIVGCLIDAAKRAGVTIRTGVAVSKVVRLLDPNAPGAFQIMLKGETLICDRLLLATGSNPQGFKLAASLGHQVQPPVPSLFTFNVKDLRLAGLAGVAVDPVRLRLQVENSSPLEQTGPLLITHWGLSGPAVLKLSAWGARVLHQTRYQAPLTINWLPQFNSETLRQELATLRTQSPRRTLASSPVGLPQRLWQRLIAHIDLDPEKRWAELSKASLNQLTQELTQGCFQVSGKGIFKDEFVTCGGINLKEVDFKTLASRVCPGLYFAGEILDIDGITGGFNFQSAWTTGWLAAQAMVAA